jgi:hypothetical protein
MTTQTRTEGRRLVAVFRTALLLLSAIPALYLVVAIQYSAITVPFWDHTELIRWISSWYNGTFIFSDLWAPHNHTRPFVYRAVMLFNAVLTGWDIRSEYVYMYAAIYGLFACHVVALHRITRSAGNPLIFPVTLLLASLLLFSPAGHNNHWWSMMFQLNVANLLIGFGLLAVFLHPDRWTSQLLGIASCWLAAYTLTNGIFAFVAVIAALQLASASRRPDGWALIWFLNLVLLLALYLPGMPPSGGSVHPAPVQVAQFAVVYLGAPLGSLLWFPFKSQFDLPLPTVFNAVCGGLLLVSAALLCWHARTRLRERRPAALILVGFIIFSVVSALATAWGRAAFDANGVSNANASRYTIFGVYLLLAHIYYVSAAWVEGWLPALPASARGWKWRILIVSAIISFVLPAFISYARAVPVYVEAHDFNRVLTKAYVCGNRPTEFDQFLHPELDFVRQLKGELLRLQIGPYRGAWCSE